MVCNILTIYINAPQKLFWLLLGQAAVVGCVQRVPLHKYVYCVSVQLIRGVFNLQHPASSFADTKFAGVLPFQSKLEIIKLYTL
jgi:hypothetical protein